MKSLIGLIRVLTQTDERLIKAHGRVIMERFPSLEVVSRCIPDQPEGIHDFETERRAIPKIASLAQRLEKEGVHAIVISCANDPAIRESRQLVKIPIIGAGSAAASLASTYSGRVGVLGITDFPPPVMTRVLGGKLIAYEKPLGVDTTLDLGGADSAIVEAGRRLIDRGADVIALGCTGFSTIGFAEVLERELEVRVVDPVVASGLYAFYLFL
ncbi:MAG: aspartate/glutamate racemase family protein [Candidatus Bathyarchaeia archaeon]